uniref:Uncharacterized protein n=1 Tax=Heterorhabditis bacteriophora TaxID=37862 RepID=A0A1I7W655_HETBA
MACQEDVRAIALERISSDSEDDPSDVFSRKCKFIYFKLYFSIVVNLYQVRFKPFFVN